MTIQTRTETYYYCTKCDKEYAEEDKQDGLVCIRCTNDLQGEEEGCQDCMYRCFEPKSKSTIKSRLQGCGRWFCEDCTSSTMFDGWYPSILCKECITKYGLEKFYGDDHGEDLWNQIQNWRIREYGGIPRREKDGKRISEGEIQQKIFEKFYKSVKKKQQVVSYKLEPVTNSNKMVSSNNVL